MSTEKRLRVSFDAEDEVLRRAIGIAASARGMGRDEYLNYLLRTHLPESAVKMARENVEADEPAPRSRRKPTSS